MLDLWAANEALLAEAGVAPERIENPRLCTACHPDLLYSYRKSNRGRLVTLAAIPKAWGGDARIAAMSDIGANLERVRDRIARPACRGGRRLADGLLIGVSKPVEV